MNRLNLIAVYLDSSRLLWVVMLLALMAASLAAGAPDGSSCGTLGC